MTVHPHTGTLLICNFKRIGPPEFNKERPVVVISPRPRAKQDLLLTVIPLSTTAPHPIRSFHHLLDPKSLPPGLKRKDTWAKCNLLFAVPLNSLSPVRAGSYDCSKYKVLHEDLEAIRRAVAIALGLPVT